MNNGFRQGIQWVLDNYSSYQVAKDLSINARTVNRYQNGETPLENMTLSTAEKLYNYYLIELSKMDRNEIFARALSCLNQIGLRRLEKGTPSIERKYLSDLRIKPMTTYFRAHKAIMQYATHFDEVDLSLIDQATEYIGTLDSTNYSDDALAENYIIYFSKETVSLEKRLKIS